MGPNAIPLCCLFGFVAMVTGLLAASLDSPTQVAACLTLQLFCGGFTMPAATGIMLNFVPPNMRTMANSIANLSYNLFGYLPAPLLYGIAYEYGGSGKSHLGMWTIQCFTCVAFFMNIVACIRFYIVLKSAKQDLNEMISQITDGNEIPNFNPAKIRNATMSQGEPMENWMTLASPAWGIENRSSRGKFSVYFASSQPMST